MRKLKNELTSARDKVDKRVKDLELESAAIGFVADLAGQAGRKSARNIPHRPLWCLY